LYTTLAWAKQNKKPNGERIYDTFDSDLMKPIKQLGYVVSNLVKITEIAEKLGTEPMGRTKAAVRQKNKELFPVLSKVLVGDKAIFAIANTYITQSDKRRALGRLRRLKSQFGKEQRRHIVEHGTVRKDWLKQYKKEIEEAKKNLRR
jgi:hypothetical protein